jgi:hypothetical protein
MVKRVFGNAIPGLADLTPRPPSLEGKGEKKSQRVLFLPPLFMGRGRRGLNGCSFSPLSSRFEDRRGGAAIIGDERGPTGSY